MDGLRVLAIDDEPPALDDLVYLLREDQRVGEVVTARDGADTQRTAATTVSLCTSSPAQRGYKTSIASLLVAAARSPCRRNLLGVLRGRSARGHTVGCSRGSESNY